MATTLDEARRAKEKAKGLLAGVQVVNGIGITSDSTGYALKVNLVRPRSPQDEIPSEIDGVPVKTEVVGVIRKLPA